MSRNRVVYRKAISMIGLMANRMAMEMKALRETMPKSHRNVLPPRKPSSQPLPRAMTICPSASGMMPMTTSCLLCARMTSHVISMAERKKNKNSGRSALSMTQANRDISRPTTQ